jgi:cytochrome c biogenesis protein CcmG, thiol:disulfide interchange protein DsbE
MSQLPSTSIQRLVVGAFLISLIALAHAHRPTVDESPEARVARRYQAQVSALSAYDQNLGSALNLTLEDQTGAQKSLSSYRGKVVLLNFWASWCPPCIKEMPDLEGLAQDMQGLPFSLVALSADDDWGSIQRVIGPQALKMDVYRDPSNQEKQHIRYGTEKLPETYVIDKQGRLRLRFISVQPWRDDELRSYLEWLAQE